MAVKDMPAADAPQTVTAVVARGRTVSLDGRKHGPGTVVELTIDDHAHLLSAGFLVDPRVAELTPSVGPQFAGPVDGVVRPR